MRHNLAERRRTNRINKLFNQLYEVLVSPEVLPLLSDVGLDGQLRKLPRKSKAAVLEAAIHCIESLQRRAEDRAKHEALNMASEATNAAAAATCNPLLLHGPEAGASAAASGLGMDGDGEGGEEDEEDGMDDEDELEDDDDALDVSQSE